MAAKYGAPVYLKQTNKHAELNLTLAVCVTKMYLIKYPVVFKIQVSKNMLMSQEYFSCNNYRSVLVTITTSLIYIYLGNMIMLEYDICTVENSGLILPDKYSNNSHDTHSNSCACSGVRCCLFSLSSKICKIFVFLHFSGYQKL